MSKILVLTCKKFEKSSVDIRKEEAPNWFLDTWIEFVDTWIELNSKLSVSFISKTKGNRAKIAENQSLVLHINSKLVVSNIFMASVIKILISI